MWLLPEATVRGLKIPLVVPLAWASIGVGALYYAGRAVARLVTGKYRSGRTDFGLPVARRLARKPRSLN